MSRPNTQIFLNLASSESTSIEGIGSVKMEVSDDFSVNLQKTLFVPDLKSNLLSVAKITDNGFNVLFKKDKAVSGEEILEADRKNDFY